MTGTFEIDGVAYPDAAASDPAALGWMQGAPPPPDKRVRFADDRFFEFPQIRWTLSHMRELVPTATVWRGGAPGGLAAPGGLSEASGRREAARDFAGDIDALRFEDLAGAELTWAESLRRTYADGIAVVHRGRLIYERYFGALQPQRPHACFSITKSYVATLAAALIHEGVLQESKRVPHYLPELTGTAYEDATLRHLLDMQVGVAYSELYADPKAQIWDYGRAGGMRPRRAGYEGADNFYEYLQTLRPEGEHGQAFAYKTINTEVLAWVMKRVTGVALPQMLSERIWSRIGCEEDGYLTIDSIGVAMGGGGLSATLRDLCRFGELMRCEGAWRGQQVIPAAVIADIRRGADPAKFVKAGYTLLPGYSYRCMWWVSPEDSGVFEGRGIHGQRLYIAPRAELVIARFASHPIASSAANDPITLPAFAALGRLLKSA